MMFPTNTKMDKIYYGLKSTFRRNMEKDLFDEAVKFATEAHSGMIRKTTSIPFVLHPLEVACITATMTNDREVLAAALLHDTVEDTNTTIEDIQERFGDRVAAMVAAETENKRKDLPPEETWRIRKEESLEHIRNTDNLDLKKLWLADKLANIRSFYRAYLEQGDDLWKQFHQSDPAQQAWYYRTVAEYTSELKEYVAYQEYCELVERVFGGK